MTRYIPVCTTLAGSSLSARPAHCIGVWLVSAIFFTYAAGVHASAPPTVESYLLENLRISKAVVEEESIAPQAPKSVVTYKRDSDNYVYQSSAATAGIFDGGPWHYINGVLTFHYPTNELPEPCKTGLICMSYVDNLGIPAMDRTKGVRRGDGPGVFLADIANAHKPSQLALTFDYDKSLITGGTVRVASDGSLVARVSFEYREDFCEGRFPVTFTHRILAPGGNSVHKWTFLELHFTNGSFAASEIDPHTLFGSKHPAIVVESNSTAYVTTKNGLKPMLSFQEVQQRTPKPYTKQRYVLPKIALIVSFVAPLIAYVLWRLRKHRT